MRETSFLLIFPVFGIRLHQEEYVKNSDQGLEMTYPHHISLLSDSISPGISIRSVSF